MSESTPVTLLEGEELIQNESPSAVAFLAQNPLASLITFGILPVLFSMNSTFVVTNERVVMKTGILRTNTEEFRIEDIQQIGTGQSLFEKLLGCGNVQFSTPATSENIVFYGLNDYESTVNTIRNQMR